MLDSTGEIRIHELLEQLDIPFEEEVEFEGLVAPNGKHLRMDFVCYDDDGEILAAIEFNGRQHYQKVSKFGGAKGLYRQQFNDNIKRQYCIAHNIRLISIPFTDEYKITDNYLMQLLYG